MFRLRRMGLASHRALKRKHRQAFAIKHEVQTPLRTPGNKERITRFAVKSHRTQEKVARRGTRQERGARRLVKLVEASLDIRPCKCVYRPDRDAALILRACRKHLKVA